MGAPALLRRIPLLWAIPPFVSGGSSGCMGTPENPHPPPKKSVCKFPCFCHGHSAHTLLPDTLSWAWCWVLTACFFPSCWLSLEGGLLYAFVGPAAAVVLVLTRPSPLLPPRLDPWVLTCPLGGLWGSAHQQWQLPHPAPVSQCGTLSPSYLMACLGIGH